MRAKSFLYVALGVFLLAAAFQLGAQQAGADGLVGDYSGLTVNQDFGVTMAVTASGDIYGRNGIIAWDGLASVEWRAVTGTLGDWQRMGNINDGLVSVQQSTTGDVKQLYR